MTMKRGMMRKLVLGACLLPVLLTTPSPGVLGANEGIWRGFKIVTVVKQGTSSDGETMIDRAQWTEPTNALPATAATAAGDGVIRVGVIDSGISAAAGLPVTAGRNYLTDESHLVDHTGHGTAVASIVAAAAPQAELVSLKIAAKGALTTPEVAATAIRGAVDEFACDILLMAFGQSDSGVLRQAVDYAAGKGVILIAAVGNEGQTYRRSRVYYPAGYGQVIGIGATDVSGEVAPFSQRAGVSFVSCGERLPALTVDGDLQEVTGTSFAAAAVAGLAARLQLEDRELCLSYLHSVVADRGAVGYDLEYGFGLIEIKGEAACEEE